MSFWQKARAGGKASFDKVYAVVDKLGPPVNRLSHKLGSQAFWPTTLDKESEKAAIILRSFCKDGFYEEVEEEVPSDSTAPRKKQKAIKKIPAEVIRNAKGLAIFTTMRTGLWISGAGGSGILVARKADGSWSPPSGIMLHTAGLGFLVGIDIYDCVLVLNTDQAVEAFSKVRCTLGTEVSAVAGPVGVGGVLETELHKRQAPIFTYLKSRGFYAGIQVDGTVVIERTDENERFYGERVSVGEIMAGKVRMVPRETRPLYETLRAAQGDTNIDESLLPSGAAPADHDITEIQEVDEQPVFGVPDKDDPDPFGVLALEQAGFEIREAGTKSRPSSEAFAFAPSPSSPIFATFNRMSIDASLTRGHSRTASSASFKPRNPVRMSDMSTQTDVGPPPLPPRSPPSSDAIDGSDHHFRYIETPPTSRSSTHSLNRIPSQSSDVANQKPPALDNELRDPSTADNTTSTRSSDPTIDSNKAQDSKNERQDDTAADIGTMTMIQEQPKEDRSDDDLDDSQDIVIVEPVVQQIRAVPQLVSSPRARLVVVNKPQPPKLPPRNPYRMRSSATDDSMSGDERSPYSPTKDTPSFESRHAHSPSVDSVASSIARLRALNDSPTKDLVDNDHTDDDYRSAHSTPPLVQSPEKEKDLRVQ